MATTIEVPIEDVTDLQEVRVRELDLQEVRVRELFERVKTSMRENPLNYNQSSYCGAVCCIAGWIDIEANGMRAHLGREICTAPTEVLEAACEAIGEVPPWLFGLATSWPSDLRDAYYVRNQTKRALVEVACLAIDRYLDERFNGVQHG